MQKEVNLNGGLLKTNGMFHTFYHVKFQLCLSTMMLLGSACLSISYALERKLECLDCAAKIKILALT
jgi:hypothetical protein